MADVSEHDKRRDKAARKQRRRLKERAALANDGDAAASDNQREAASSERGLSQLQIMELSQFDVEDEAFDADQFPLSARSRVDVEHGVADGCRVRDLCHLEGRRLENLPVEAIKALIQMHQVALERSQTMLVTKLKSQNPTLFQT
ncbi:hypothetical protein P43SY_008360 [Pythium insidiosum]|uniref:Uncharacterized protein n=1 Tax=Pythium insidiosum TaxID=114742 RepID=A0AAD5M6A2_PYTIN|nr:hypothetical protein P43SY_008360 [Pythium insidiosum]